MQRFLRRKPGTIGVKLLVLFISSALLTHAGYAEDWPKYGRDLGNSAHSAEFTLGSTNIASLQSRWTFQTNGEVSTTPAVATVNGKSMLFIGSWTGVFYALDAVTGQQIWTFTVDYVGGRCVQTGPWCRIGSSAAVDVATNMVYFGSYSGYLYALDAATGQLVWKAQVGDSLAGYEVWASPAIYNGMVFIGVSSHGDAPCLPGGSVNAYNALTGQLVWTFNTIDQNTCPGGGTCVGGSIWSSLAIDDVNGIVYAGTGNPGSTCQPPTQNAGLYPDSVLALNANTGELLNYFQAIANDQNDKDFGSSPILHVSGTVNQCVSPTARPTLHYWLTEPSKNGYVYTLGRGPNGLTGTEQENFAHISGFIGTPGFVPAILTKSCDNNGHKIISYTNIVYAPGSGGAVWLYQQLGDGVMTLRKSTPSGQGFLGAPAVVNDIALVGGTDGNLYAVDYNGNALVSFPFGSSIYGGIAISNGRVYFGTKDGAVHSMSVNGR